MTLLAFGINHTTAPLALRERVAFAPETVEKALHEARAQAGLTEVSILSTCNRTEIYASSSLDSQGLFDWLVSHTAISAEDLARCYYCYQDDEAVRHMMKVAGGLDSLVLGEPQILGQMKSAFAVARAAGAIGTELHGTFQQVFNIAKRVRSETAIGENPVSVAFAAVSLARQIFSDLRRSTALLIGAGETIALVARHLYDQGVSNIIVANRTLERAQLLSEPLGGQAIILNDIPDVLSRCDIIISSTAAPGIILTLAVAACGSAGSETAPSALPNEGPESSSSTESAPTGTGIRDLSGFAVWTAAELSDRNAALGERIGPDGSARETLRDYGNHRFRFLRRDSDGFPEQHDSIIDVVIVQSGRGELVLGGTLVDPESGSTGEWRGSDITGGERHPLGPGDIMHIPATVPHRFLVPEGEHFTYVLVKFPAP